MMPGKIATKIILPVCLDSCINKYRKSKMHRILMVVNIVKGITTYRKR